MNIYYYSIDEIKTFIKLVKVVSFNVRFMSLFFRKINSISYQWYRLIFYRNVCKHKKSMFLQVHNIILSQPHNLHGPYENPIIKL